jgi:hypothetical protein
MCADYVEERIMQHTRLNQSRLVVGVALVVIAVVLFVFARGDTATAGIVALGILGLTSIAISRRG